MAVKVDKEGCIGCGACVSACPEGFEMREGKSSVRNEDADCIDNAIAVCPVGAISK